MHMCCSGSNSFRISIEWSRIVPLQGQVEQRAIDRYHQMFDCMDRYIIDSTISLLCSTRRCF